MPNAGTLRVANTHQEIPGRLVAGALFPLEYQLPPSAAVARGVRLELGLGPSSLGRGEALVAVSQAHGLGEDLERAGPARDALSAGCVQQRDDPLEIIRRYQLVALHRLADVIVIAFYDERAGVEAFGAFCGIGGLVTPESPGDAGACRV